MSLHSQSHAIGSSDDHSADTLANLNTLISDATLDDSSASRTPTAHAASHTSGADDIQSATNAVKGLATAAQITALEQAVLDISALESGYARRPAVITIAVSTSAPPTEVHGDRYILDNSGAPHAGWDGASQGDIVQFVTATWVAETPTEGWVAYCDTDNKDALCVDDGTLQWELRSVATTDHDGLSNNGGNGSHAAIDLKIAMLTRETAVAGGKIELLEGTDNGTDKVIFQAPATLTANRTITVPDADVTLSDIATNSSARHTRAHTLTSASDHSGGNDKIIYTGNAGAVTELALGAKDAPLLSGGTTSAPIFGAMLVAPAVITAAGATPADSDVSTWSNATIGIVVGTGGRVFFTFKNASDVYYVEATAI